MTDTNGPQKPNGVDVDAVVVGAGFGGLFMVYRLIASGFSVRGFESAEDVGGVWFWNTYPGARCDVESPAYSYSFSAELQQQWSWSERYAKQTEILGYLRSVAQRFDLRRHFRFSTRVKNAVWNESRARWLIETDQDERVSAQYFISAVGCLSAARMPELSGLDNFRGEWYHSGQWPKAPVTLAGKRVAVIGTGSSGIQIITTIAPEVAQLTVFQRTPSYSVPARNRPMDRDYERRIKEQYARYRAEARGLILPNQSEPADARAFTRPPRGSGHDLTAQEREAELQARWDHGYSGAPFLFAFKDMMSDPAVNGFAADFARRKIREIVRDPNKADQLIPQGYPLGAKRLCVDTGYYETFNRDCVSIVDTRADPIAAITPTGLQLRSGRSFEFDTIIFATGYDAMTGALAKIDIRGKRGHALRDAWAEGPRAYMGLCVAGFPNMFVMTGPGSPSVISNVVDSLEQHGELIADALVKMRSEGLSSIEAEGHAQDRWVRHVDEVANTTLWPQADSWYNGSNIPGKPRVFMVYVAGPAAYRDKCAEMKAEGWLGFRFERASTEGGEEAKSLRGGPGLGLHG